MLTAEQVKTVLDRREKDIAEAPEGTKPKASQLSKTQKDKLKDLADEFLSEFGNAEELAARYQLFLLAAGKVL